MPTFWVLLKTLNTPLWDSIVNLCITHELLVQTNQIQTAVPKYKNFVHFTHQLQGNSGQTKLKRVTMGVIHHSLYSICHG